MIFNGLCMALSSAQQDSNEHLMKKKFPTKYIREWIRHNDKIKEVNVDW